MMGKRFSQIENSIHINITATLESLFQKFGSNCNNIQPPGGSLAGEEEGGGQLQWVRSESVRFEIFKVGGIGWILIVRRTKLGICV